MSGKEFFDEDLLKSFHEVRKQAAEEGYLEALPNEDEQGAIIKKAPAPAVAGVPRPRNGPRIGPAVEPSPGSPGAAVQGFKPRPAPRHAEEINDQVANAHQELERLRQRQQMLEREKGELENLRSKQQKFQDHRKELLGHLQQSVVKLEAHELNAEQLRELAGATRKQFSGFVAELQRLKEEEWSEETLGDELTRALALLDNVRIEYNKGLSRIEALISSRPESAGKDVPGPVLFESRAGGFQTKGFSYWFMAGLAASLPLIIVMTILLSLLVLAYMGKI